MIEESERRIVDHLAFGAVIEFMPQRLSYRQLLRTVDIGVWLSDRNISPKFGSWLGAVVFSEDARRQRIDDGSDFRESTFPAIDLLRFTDAELAAAAYVAMTLSTTENCGPEIRGFFTTIGDVMDSVMRARLATARRTQCQT